MVTLAKKGYYLTGEVQTSTWNQPRPIDLLFESEEQATILFDYVSFFANEFHTKEDLSDEESVTLRKYDSNFLVNNPLIREVYEKKTGSSFDDTQHRHHFHDIRSWFSLNIHMSLGRILALELIYVPEEISYKPIISLSATKETI